MNLAKWNKREILQTGSSRTLLKNLVKHSKTFQSRYKTRTPSESTNSAHLAPAEKMEQSQGLYEMRT